MLRRCELINLWVFALGVYPSDMVQQEESQSFQEGLWFWVLPQAFHPFIHQCPTGRNMALWAPWFRGLQFPPSNGISEVLSCTSCNGGFRPQSLLRFALKNIHKDLWSLVWPSHPNFQWMFCPAWSIGAGTCSMLYATQRDWTSSTPNSTEQASLGVNIWDFYWPNSFITARPLSLYQIRGCDQLNIPCFESVSRRGSCNPSLCGAPVPSSGKTAGIFRQKKMISLLTYLLSSFWTKVCTSSLIDSGVSLNDIVNSCL